jgi:sortase A
MRLASEGSGHMPRLLVAAFLAAITVSACGSRSSSPPTPGRTGQTTSLATATSPPLPGGGVIPVHLALPSIGVSAAVAAVGETPAGDLQTPPDWDTVGWFSPGFRPGAPGHAVLNGHLDTTLADRPTAVFWNLRRLQPGDAVILDGAGGSTLRFTVTALDYYPAENAPLNRIFGPSNDSIVELVTCAGTWRGPKLGYNQRLVVTATLDRA